MAYPSVEIVPILARREHYIDIGHRMTQGIIPQAELPFVSFAFFVAESLLRPVVTFSSQPEIFNH